MRKLLLMLAMLWVCFFARPLIGSDASDSTSSGGPTPHGYALIHLVHNQTPYPMKFFKDPTALIQRLPEGAAFRLKGYFANNYYYWRALDINGKWKFSCTWPSTSGGKDDTDSATVFTVVKKYASNDAVVIASKHTAFGKDKTKKVIAVNKDTYEIELIDYKDGDARNPWAEWKFAGREPGGAVDFDNLWLGNPAAVGSVKGQLAFLAARSVEHEIKRLKKELAPYAATLGPLDSLEEMRKKSVSYIAFKSARWGAMASHWSAAQSINGWIDTIQRLAKFLAQIIIDAGVKEGESQSDWETRIAAKIIEPQYRDGWQAIINAGSGDPVARVKAMLMGNPFAKLFSSMKVAVPGGSDAAKSFLQWVEIATPDIKPGFSKKDFDDLQRYGIKSFELSNRTHPTRTDVMLFRRNRVSWQSSLFGTWLEGSLKVLDNIVWSDSGGPDASLPDVGQEGPLIVTASQEGIRRLASRDRLMALYERQERGEESPDDGVGYVGDKGDPNLGQFQDAQKTYIPWDGDMLSLQLLSGTTPIEREGMIVGPGASSQVTDIYVAQQPEMKGHGYEKIDDFGPEKSVALGSFFADGYAWLEQSMLYPWKCTILFKAKSGDDGNVRIALGTATGPDAEYLIVIGDDNNTVSRIYKQRSFVAGQGNSDIKFEPVLTVVPKKGIPSEVMPCVRPGRFESFWVSLNNGFIVVGKGEPGVGIIMAWKDQNYKLVNKIGFSAYGTETVYQDVQQIDYPMVSKVPFDTSYVTIDGNVALGTGNSPAWLKLPLSPADAGALHFIVKGNGDFRICFVQDPNLVEGPANKGYDIIFGAQGVSICRHENPQDAVVTSDIKIDRSQKVWVSLYKGMILIGQGPVGTDPFLFWQDWFGRDESVLQGIARIGFSSGPGTVAISDVSIWPEVEIGFGDVKTQYGKESIEFIPIKGALEVVAPFWYRGFQDGPLVRVRELFLNGLKRLESTPRPGATYTYDFSITKNGVAQFTLLGMQKSQEELATQRNQILRTRSAEATEFSATVLSRSGVEAASASLAVGLSAGMLGGAILSRVLAATDEAKLSEIQSLAQRYIPPPEQITRSTAQLQAPSMAIQVAKRNVEDGLASAASLGLEQKIEKYKEILDNVIGFACLEGASKSRIIGGINAVCEEVTGRALDNSTYGLYGDLFTVFLKAYSNRFLIDRMDNKDAQQRREWYLRANGIFRDIYKKPSVQGDRGIDISFKDEYLWLPESFKVPGQGLFVCEIKADSDAFIGFAGSSDPTRNTGKPMYEIVIGKWSNTKTEISRKHLGDPVISFDQSISTDDKPYDQLALDPLSFQTYWINVDDGKITIGRGLPDAEKKIIELQQIATWKDPYAAQQVKAIGLSSWNAGVTVRNLMVYPAMSKIKSLDTVKKEIFTKLQGSTDEA
ncbi:MAG: hypothetical protein WCW33_02935 [Candidatus Babeliales bacterium]